MKICNFEDCCRKHSAKGFCKVHYNMWLKGIEPHTILKPGKWQRNHIKCSFEGCLNKHRAKGWCSTHYNQMSRTGSTHQPNRKIYITPKLCGFPDCFNIHKAKGYCSRHYYKWRYHNPC